MTVTPELRTRDLFEAGLAMSRGLALRRVDVEPGAHPRVTFVFEGPEAGQVAIEYRRGRATANVSLLKQAMDYLRRRLWSALEEARSEAH